MTEFKLGDIIEGLGGDFRLTGLFLDKAELTSLDIGYGYSKGEKIKITYKRLNGLSLKKFDENIINDMLLENLLKDKTLKKIGYDIELTFEKDGLSVGYRHLNPKDALKLANEINRIYGTI